MTTIDLNIRVKPASREDFLIPGRSGTEKYRFGKQYIVRMDDGTWRFERFDNTAASRRYFTMVFDENRAYAIENANEIGNIYEDTNPKNHQK